MTDPVQRAESVKINSSTLVLSVKKKTNLLKWKKVSFCIIEIITVSWRIKEIKPLPFGFPLCTETLCDAFLVSAQKLSCAD